MHYSMNMFLDPLTPWVPQEGPLRRPRAPFGCLKGPKQLLKNALFSQIYKSISS